MNLSTRTSLVLLGVGLAAGVVVFAAKGVSAPSPQAATPNVAPATPLEAVVASPGAEIAEREIARPAPEAPAGPTDVIDAERVERMGLLAGTITAEEYGPGFDAALRKIASEFAVKNLRSNVEERASDYCGFRSLRDLTSALEGDGRVPASLVPELERLNASATVIAAQIEDYVNASIELGLGLEEWDNDQPHDSQAWADSNLDAANEGLLRMMISTSVGERQFVLHFDSYDHPSLEGELQRLDLQKQSFWNAVRAQ